ncbi:epoxide hydrolase 3, partial [Myiozetetes cayanensis]|uniref:epoxide hydrolase 3 n=1 Tax=Myiozetetes cayanensis TaxID=478635 RepID=UPI002160B317
MLSCAPPAGPHAAAAGLRALVARVASGGGRGGGGSGLRAVGVGVLLRRGPGPPSGGAARTTPGLADGTFGEHRYLRLKDSGLRLHYVTRGPPTAPLVLLLHGFPQNWFCWRHLMQDLARDRRVVALDLRGCGASEKPPGRDSYRLELLLGDICGVIEALGTPAGSPRCVLVGHDWGGVLAWEVAAARPALVEKLVVMDAPQRGTMADFMARHPSQLLRSSYIFLFQLPLLPELLLALNDFQLVRWFLTGPCTGVRGAALTEPEIEAYLFNLAQPGPQPPCTSTGTSS